MVVFVKQSQLFFSGDDITAALEGDNHDTNGDADVEDDDDDDIKFCGYFSDD